MFPFLNSGKKKNTRGESYYDRENMVHNHGDLLTIFNPVTDQQYKSGKTIKFSGIALNEITEANIKKVLKEPDFVIGAKDSNLGHKVLFYRHVVDKYIFVMQFHFLKGGFLFVSNSTSSTSVITREEKLSFTKRITDKYLSGINVDLTGGFDMKITDTVNNFLSITDDVNFKVNYINCSDFNKQLMKNPDLMTEIQEDGFDNKLNEYF
jgi:hypothetical protein